MYGIFVFFYVRMYIYILFKSATLINIYLTFSIARYVNNEFVVKNIILQCLKYQLLNKIKIILYCCDFEHVHIIAYAFEVFRKVDY